ncbi:MAG: hypothetical protein AAF205_06015 [Pseudomonadota bacterium]
MSKRPHSTRLAGHIDEDLVTFEIDTDLVIEPRAEAFLAIALFLGMSRGRDIKIDENVPVSGRLVENLHHFQRICRQWNPDFTVRAMNGRFVPPRRQAATLSTFSGGVDSMATFIRQQQALTHLLVLNIFDRKGDEQPFSELKTRIGDFTKMVDKRMIAIETNAWDVAAKYDMAPEYLHGAFLGSVGAHLGVETYYIPSSYTYRDLKPWGSHPVLDPLWSTETTTVIHDGADLRRTEKTALIAERPELLEHLQVCWFDKVRNCSRCSKCVRTAITLDLLGVEPNPFARDDASRDIRRIEISSDSSASYVWDIKQLAEEKGRDDVAAAAAAHLRAHVRKRNLYGLVEATLGPRGTALVNRFRNRPYTGRKVMLRNPDSFV